MSYGTDAHDDPAAAIYKAPSSPSLLLFTISGSEKSTKNDEMTTNGDEKKG
jgi:hypothetical protein